MALRLGVHAERLSVVASLATAKGRRAHRRFALEGATLLGEALRSGAAVEELYVTQRAYDATALVRRLERSGTPTFIVSERSAAKISDLETPPGIVALLPLRYAPLAALFGAGSVTLVLGDLNDPGNAGTLLRSADAFGAAGVVFGRLGVEPYHPKVVRAAMGSLFRVAVALADPQAVAEAAKRSGVPICGLHSSGEPLEPAHLRGGTALVVGQERHGLGRWTAVCGRTLAIRMQPGRAESLNAAVAGSIALYEASKR
jgi:TrmH family RNA methyltransferase